MVKSYIVRPYQKEDFALWNDFINQAKNATFLFHRNFMEYHQDRFEDFSLMVFDEKKLVAILPANKVDKTVFSHQGLTYGGIVLSYKTKASEEISIFEAILSFLKINSIKVLKIKQLPVFYFEKACQQLDYFLFQKGASLSRKDLNLAIDLRSDFQISKSKLKHFKKANDNISMVEENDFSNFWENALQPRLLEKHQTKPVHSVQEIALLKSYFPDKIKQFSAYFEGQVVAGITIFDAGKVVKSQYGATTSKGEELRALDFLFIHLIEKYKKEGKHFFDMGIVNENEGKNYNIGLLNQKEELGCAVYNQDYYTLKLDD